MNKKFDELAVNLVEAWLKHESEVSQEIGRTSLKAESKSVKEVAQAFLDFQHALLNGELPSHLEADEDTVDNDSDS